MLFARYDALPAHYDILLACYVMLITCYDTLFALYNTLLEHYNTLLTHYISNMLLARFFGEVHVVHIGVCRYYKINSCLKFVIDIRKLL
jgi:hypothetical protein